MASLALAFDILAKDKGATKTFDKVGEAADRAGKAGTRMKVAMGAGLAAAGVAVTAFAKDAVGKFAEVEDATGAAGVQFGKQVSVVENFAKKAAKNFGLSRSAALDAANNFATLGKSAGLNDRALSDFATKFTGLAGDLASFKGTSAQQAIDAIGAALRGEAEPIRAYGVLLNDATLRSEALAQGLIKTTKQALTPQQKVLATQSLLFKSTADAQGDFARTSSSTANTQKRLNAQMENLQVTLGSKLAPAMTAIREQLIAAIDFYTRNSTVIKPLAIAVGTLGGSLFVVVKAVKAWTAVQAALNVVLAANPIGLVVVAVAAFVAALVVAYKKSETFRDIVQAVFKSVGGFVLTMVDVWLGGFQILAKGLSHLPFIGDKFKGVAEGIGNVRDKIHEMKSELDQLGQNTVRVPVVLDVRTSLGKAVATATASKLDRLGRAGGGPVNRNQIYRVGEREPEWFVPDVSGRIVNQRQAAEAVAGGGLTFGDIHVTASAHDPDAGTAIVRHLTTMAFRMGYV